ncbi:cytochrome P450 [Haladaptatus sp.]|uniref:cytochrome P450 n=1 Tax=Haladaptatus sp. TaxID=1973141 RepID=UPI003C4D03A5
MSEKSNDALENESPAALRTDEVRLDPFSWYREMRDEAPVRFDPDRGVWDVFRYDDVRRVLKGHDRFSSSMEFQSTDEPSSPESEAGEQERGSFGEMLIATDPPKHDRIRSVVNEHFQADAIRSYRPRVEAIAEELVADIEPGRTDLVEAFSYPFPVDVIAGVLGVPREDRATFKRWSDAFIGSSARDEDGLSPEEGMMKMSEYFGTLFEERRKDPRDDLLTAIATAESGESALSGPEMVSLCILLLIAGNVTTTNLLTNAIWCFDEHDLLDDVQNEEIPLGSAVEEVLRYRSPVQHLERFARQDVEFGGKTIREGDEVVAWVGSANRDERKFDSPDTFDPTRRPNSHLAFGQGIHYCLGAPLARLEAEVGFTILFDTFDIVDVDTTDLSPASREIYGVELLPVTLE